MKIRKVRALPVKFDDEVTIDHWIAREDVSRGYKGEAITLTFRDRATNWIECCGMSTNTIKLTEKALSYIVGTIGELLYFYSDVQKCIGFQ